MTGRGQKRERAKRDVLPELNARVHEAARRFAGTEPGRDRWDFTCECGEPDCRAPVSLRLDEYDALRAADRPVLAPGHAKVAPDEAASSAG